jgi:hypothetical protein
VKVVTYIGFRPIWGITATEGDRLGYELRAADHGLFYAKTGNSNQYLFEIPDVDDGEWHQLIQTLDATATITIAYKDGFYVDSDAAFTLPNLSGATLYISSRKSGDTGAECLVDEFAAFSRVLTPTEAKQLYEQGRP